MMHKLVFEPLVLMKTVPNDFCPEVVSIWEHIVRAPGMLKVGERNQMADWHNGMLQESLIRMSREEPIRHRYVEKEQKVKQSALITLQFKLMTAPSNRNKTNRERKGGGTSEKSLKSIALSV
mmetsp:Transcript_9136/g.27435  ORF Transcript_9136/g.27435 Transcript_9136/m.27435 type:complete len:122 (+) Transcript_9136:2864-3229(+)